MYVRPARPPTRHPDFTKYSPTDYHPAPRREVKKAVDMRAVVQEVARRVFSDPRIQKAVGKRAVVQPRKPTARPPAALSHAEIVEASAALDRLEAQVTKMTKAAEPRIRAQQQARAEYDAKVDRAVAGINSIQKDLSSIRERTDGVRGIRTDLEKFTASVTQACAPRGRGGFNGR